VTRGGVAEKIRREKDEHPERFCHDPRCLWRVVRRAAAPKPCPRHSAPSSWTRWRALDGDVRAELMSAVSDIYRAHDEAAGHDASYDAGEFSGPAHHRAAESEVDELGARHGFAPGELGDVYQSECERDAEARDEAREERRGR